ncbi:MAG: hypothetical protein AAF945_03745 [Actinomycetota bacterium]
MIEWLSAIAALALVGVVAARTWRRGRSGDDDRRDPHWGDLPPDQMSP